MRFLHPPRPPAGTTAEPATEVAASVPARRTFERFRMAGLSTDEAGNLTAHLAGLRIVGQPWTVAQIERLRFLRALVESGRLQP